MILKKAPKLKNEKRVRPILEIPKSQQVPKSQQRKLLEKQSRTKKIFNYERDRFQ
jgi:hypothetical protein